MKAYERFIEYVKIKSPCYEDVAERPSSKGQLELARYLLDELKGMGVENSKIDKYGYLYAKLPASLGYESKPSIGLISYLDILNSYIDYDISPIIHKNYQGEEIRLNDKVVLDPKVFKDLAEESHKGMTLITSDGNTLLGTDGKAGIAEIMTAIEYIIQNNVKHPEICISFIPDSSNRCDLNDFNLLEFSADFAYTLDCGKIGYIEYDNFNAARAKIVINGRTVHTGDAKGIMKNASIIAVEIASMLPRLAAPEYTEGKEGFFHLERIKGDITKCELLMIIRDHDNEKFEEKKSYIKKICEYIDSKYGGGIVEVEIEEQYKNMFSVIKNSMFLIKNAKKAFASVSMDAKEHQIRGGTAGSILSFMGIPCPNLTSGGYAFHGPYEHIFAEDIDKMVEMLVHLVTME